MGTTHDHGAQGPLTLGAFIVDRHLGRGGMASVWAGRHIPSATPVAIKVLTDERARHPAAQRAFRNEVRAQARLTHANVIEVHEHGRITPASEAISQGELPAGAPYLVMEYADRGSLQGLGSITLPWTETRRLLVAILDGLAHAHARGTVHRDLKPANILLSATGGQTVAKLADFGLAHALDADREEHAFSGTPPYMSPEQFRGEWRDYGPWTDLYALGCVAYQLVTGKPPFMGADARDLAYAHQMDAPPAVESIHLLPDGFEQWLGQLLAKEPRQRFQRAADAAWALLALDDRRCRAVATTPWDTLDDPYAERMRQMQDASPSSFDVLGASRSTEPGPSLGTHQWTMEAGRFSRSPEDVALEVPTPTRWRAGVDEPPQANPLEGAGLGLFGMRDIAMVGRGEVEQQLWDALVACAESGRTRTVVLTGPAGVGKSRACRWLAERAGERGVAQTLKAVHSPISGAADGLPRMLGQRVRTQGLTGPGVHDRCLRFLRARGVSAPYLARSLATIVEEAGSSVDSDSADLQAAPDTPRPTFADARERLAAVAGVLDVLARERPLIVWLDDVQWGLDGLSLVTHLRKRSQQQPVLLLLTSRDEALAEQPAALAAVSELVAAEDVVHIPLAPLDGASSATLLERLLGLSGELARTVQARSGGNPLFATQLLGDWVARGLLERTPDGFALQSGAAVELPDDLHGLWRSRIGRLLDGVSDGDPTTNAETLEIAATLGIEVNDLEWRAVCSLAGIRPADGLLEAMLDQRLAARSDGLTDDWRFAHGMLRESLERMAAEEGRATEHHRKCARFLASLPGRRNVSTRLGRHLLAAGEPLKAAAPLLRGIDELVSGADYRAAADLVRERDEALEAAGVAPHALSRAQGWRYRSRICRLLGEVGEAERWAIQTLDLASDHASEAEATRQQRHWRKLEALTLREFGQVLRVRGELERAQGALSDGLDMLRGFPEERAALASIRLNLGWLMQQKGDLPRAKELFEEATADAVAAGDLYIAAACQLGRSSVALAEGHLDESERHTGQARRFIADWGSPPSLEARALNMLGEVARARGDLDAAERFYREGLEARERIGAGDAFIPRVNLGLTRLERGSFSAAKDVLEECLAICRRQGRRHFEGMVRVMLLPCAAAEARWDTWDELLRRARRLLHESGFVDGDIALCAEHAARLAGEAKEYERGAKAWRLAVDQWRGLGRDDKVEAAEEALVELELASV